MYLKNSNAMYYLIRASVKFVLFPLVAVPKSTPATLAQEGKDFVCVD